jgi:hypothetical protein
MRPIIAFGRIRDGRIALDDKPAYETAVRRLREGDSVVIRIEPAAKQRSIKQNAFWHGTVIPAFVEHCGYEFAEMKRVLALELIPVTVHKLDGSTVTVPGHTADLSTTEFNDLIERAQRLGATLGIYIPDPGEVAA